MDIRKDEKPTMQLLLSFPGNVDIVQQIGTTYTKFGTFLLKDDNQVRVTALAKQCSNDASEINMATLREWLQGSGVKPVTWGKLVEVLKKCRLDELAEKIESHFKSSYNVPEDPPQELPRREEDHSTVLDVFISYKWEEQVTSFADALAAELEKRKIGYWKDDHRMMPGDNITEHIVEGITKCSVFVPILSEGYVSSSGERWCQKECAFAVQEKKKIVPIQWNDTRIPDEIIFQMRPDLLRAIYDPNADPETRKQKLEEICDAVCTQVAVINSLNKTNAEN